MTYTDSTTVTKRLKNITGNTGTIDTDLMTEALQSADNIINSQLDEEGIPIPSDQPDTLVNAATYYTAADILDAQNNMSQNRNPTAKAWEDRGSQLVQSYIKKYINDNPTADTPQSYHHGLSDSKRPFSGYMRSYPRKRWY